METQRDLHVQLREYVRLLDLLERENKYLRKKIEEYEKPKIPAKVVVLEAMDKGKRTVPAIVKSTGRSRAAIGNVLRELYRAGHLRRRGPIKVGQAYLHVYGRNLATKETRREQ